MSRANITTFVSVLLTAFVMAAAVAHLLELPTKMTLNGAEYMTVQQIYRGWALLGIVNLRGVGVDRDAGRHGAQPAPGLVSRSDGDRLHGCRAGRVLGFHISREPRDKQLDTAPRTLAAIADAVGVLARSRGGATVFGPRDSRRFAACARNSLISVRDQAERPIAADYRVVADPAHQR